MTIEPEPKPIPKQIEPPKETPKVTIDLRNPCELSEKERKEAEHCLETEWMVERRIPAS